MITIKYTCAQCGIVDRDVIVPEREPGSDVVDYVKNIIGGCVRDDHSIKSPQCQATHITNLKIPIDTNNPNASIGSKVS